MWDKLKNIYSKIGSKLIYLILQKLLNYPKINKLKRYGKPIMQIFGKIQYLCKSLYTIMTLGQDLENIIILVIVFKILHNNFNITIANLLKIRDKIIDQIYSIL